MKKKFATWQLVVSLILVALLTSGGSYIYFNHQYQINRKEVAGTNDDLAPISDLYARILKDYVGNVESKTLIDGALSGMTQAIGDPYSTYLPEDQAQDLEDSLASSIEGIGASLTIIDEKPQIAQAPIKGTPAEKAGLKAGDLILKVDGTDVTKKTLDEIVALVRGEKGSEVTLDLERDGKAFSVTVTRDTIPVASVNAKMQTDDVGYLNITSFSENTAAEFQEQISFLRESGAMKFIFDVRQNPGGLLDQVVQMGSMVLTDGETIVKWENKDGEKFQNTASSDLDNGFKVTEPVTVLVDSGSASAAEIFAGAIKDNQRGKIIGTTTYGKGTMQDVEGLGDEKLKLTTGKWYTPNGTWVNEVGLAPDEEISYPDYAYMAPLTGEQELTIGSTESSVKAIKVLMNGLGYSLEETETFDAPLEDALKDFQEKNNLTVSGTWNVETANSLQTQLIEQLNSHDPFMEKALEILGE
ncbi:S41 family peptidase [Enterococcus timonensis]|uniref:S41 family peptidase n=1 Tax=Enterococcus timonensis TaxID=1852364 RepID=UPI0008D8E5E5|nr:S41 family peptidase [Enterococcus timonensis]